MKNKINLFFLVILLLFGVTACSNLDISYRKTARPQTSDDTKTIESPEEYKTEEDNAEENKTYESIEPEIAEEDKYILPYSDTRKLTESDLASLSNTEIELARNEIYARHGRIFKTDHIKNYFESQSWYKGEIDPDNFDENVFNEIEKYNINFIVEYEKNGSKSDSYDTYVIEDHQDGQQNQIQPGQSYSQPDQPYSQPDYSIESNNVYTCYHCNGLGHCFYCLYGECSSCHGTGTKSCTACIGLGRCGKCGGNGYYYHGVGIQFGKYNCTYCNGSGTCSTCHGTRVVTCNVCFGNGKCNQCFGNYYCLYCNGTGYLQ